MVTFELLELGRLSVQIKRCTMIVALSFVSEIA